MSKPDIEIVCPKCREKADFFSASLIGTYHIKPSHFGKIRCLQCGLNIDSEINMEMYFYKVSVGKRILYARTYENLLRLRKYFFDDKRLQGDPDLDFPKEFYKNRLSIVKAIDKIIAKKLSS